MLSDIFLSESSDQETPTLPVSSGEGPLWERDGSDFRGVEREESSSCALPSNAPPQHLELERVSHKREKKSGTRPDDLEGSDFGERSLHTVERLLTANSGETFGQEILEGLSETLGLSVIITDKFGKVLRTNDRARLEFQEVFSRGCCFEEDLNQATSPETLDYPYMIGSLGEEMVEKVLRGGSFRRSLCSDPPKVYRYFQLKLCLESEGASTTAHCFLDVTPEKQLFETYRSNFSELSSMREIIDLLYESMSTQEVINLILVAVTAQQGFGFNRAFFLEVSDHCLRGRLGIGPDSAEEAHQIWTRMSESNPSLRETLNHLSQAGEPPDAATQALALFMNLPLKGCEKGSCEDGNYPNGIIKSCHTGRPVLVNNSELLSEAEIELFQLLKIDTIAVVPLTIRDRLAGVLLADNFITRKPISSEDLNLLKTFSGYAALALERSSLHDELTQNLEKLRLANRELQTNQKRLLQAEKLSALGELATSVSHEIRNPLVSIGGLAKSVMDDESQSESSREALSIIASEVQRLERFLKETLDFAKPTMGTFEQVDLVPLVHDVLCTFRDEIQRVRIDLILDLPKKSVMVSADPDYLRGALSNLIKNSQEALGLGGKIRIRLKERKGRAVIEVADTGPGIPDEARNLIFEPFFTTKKMVRVLDLQLRSNTFGTWEEILVLRVTHLSEPSSRSNCPVM